MSGKRKRPARDSQRRGTSKGGRRAKASGGQQTLGDDLPELRQARALWHRQQLPAALALFQRVAQQHPDNVLALVDASRAFGAAYQFEYAEGLLDRLLELARGRSHVLHLAGQSYRIIRRGEKALACFRAALEGDQPTADTHLETALLLERRNQVDEALDHAEARLAMSRDDAEGRLVLGRLLRRKGSLAEAQSLLETVAKQRGAHWMTRSRAWAELATLLDRGADYDEAWDAMLAGKRIIARHCQSARQHRDRLVPPLLALAEQVTAEHFARWRLIASKADGTPVTLLTGLPRSGTTLLERVLDAHPDVVTCDEFDAFPRFIFPAILANHPVGKITPEFLDALPEKHLARQRRFYAGFLSAALGQPVGGRVLIDKNPALLPLTTVYRRCVAGGRLIVALRDPRDVLVSCLMAYLPLNDFSVDFLSLESAAERLVADLNVWLMLREKLSSDWIEIRYEDLLDDLRGTATRTLAHLGLPWDDRVLEYRQAVAEKQVNSPSYEAVAQPIYKSAQGRWRNYAKQLEAELPKIEPLLGRFGYETG